MSIYRSASASPIATLVPVLAMALLAAAGCSRSPAPGAALATPAAGLELGSGGDERAGAPAKPRVAPPAVGVRLYAALCASCHGDDGRGDTPLGADLDPPPSDLTRCNFKLRSTASGTLPREDDLLRTLYVGIPGSAMPSFGEVMPVPVLRGLVREVSRRCERLTREPGGERLAVLDGPGAARASAKRGERVYRREGCASCHGDGGEGDGAAAGNLKDAQGRRIRPRDYTRGVYRSGFTAGDVYRAFSTGLDGTPMPALPEEVSSRDRWDLTRYILSLAGRRVWRVLSQPPTWHEPALGRRRPWAGK